MVRKQTILGAGGAAGGAMIGAQVGGMGLTLMGTAISIPAVVPSVVLGHPGTGSLPALAANGRGLHRSRVWCRQARRH